MSKSPALKDRVRAAASQFSPIEPPQATKPKPNTPAKAPGKSLSKSTTPPPAKSTPHAKTPVKTSNTNNEPSTKSNGTPFCDPSPTPKASLTAEQGIELLRTMGYAITPEHQVAVKRITPHCDPEPKITKVHEDLVIKHPDALPTQVIKDAIPVERMLPPAPTRPPVAVASPSPRSTAPAPVRMQPKLSGPLDLSTIDNATKPIDRTLAIRFTNVGEWEIKMCNINQTGQTVPKWRLLTEVTQNNRSAHLTYWLPGDKDHTSYMNRSPRVNDIAKISVIQSMTLQAPRFSQLHSVGFHCDDKTKTVFVDDVTLQNACPYAFDSFPNPMISQSPSIAADRVRSASVPEELDLSMFDV